MTSNRFLAFVEDVSATNSVVGESNEANEVIELYRENCGKDPTHLVWLDGIEEFYFNSLPWIGTPCDSTSKRDREVRRSHLNSLDSSKLSVFLVALHKDDNSLLFEELAESAWLEVSIFKTGVTGSVPGLQSADYEQQETKTVWIVLTKCLDRGLLSKLKNAFSLDHLEEANFNLNELTLYQFIPYKNPRFTIKEIELGTDELGGHYFVRRPREV